MDIFSRYFVLSLTASLILAAPMTYSEAQRVPSDRGAAYDQDRKEGQKTKPKVRAQKQRTDDASITEKVKNEIMKDPLLSAAEINVTTKDGIVSLSGVVDDQAKVDRALQIARAQKDVKSVEDILVVRSPSAPASEPPNQSQ